MSKKAILNLRWIDGEKRPVDHKILELPVKTANKFLKQWEGNRTPKYAPLEDAALYGIIAEPVKPEPVKSEPKPAAPKQEAPKAEPAKAEPAKAEPAKTEPAK